MQGNSLKQRVRLGRLFDAYGDLLTEKQQKCMELYFCDDLSLGEIADDLEVSRQAIHDLIKRVEKTLERYENKLELLAQEEKVKRKIELAITLMRKHCSKNIETVELKQILRILEELNDESR